MKIYVNNLKEYAGEIKKVARKVIEGEGLKGELSITFVTEDEMIKLNRRYKGRDSVTDVLSFPFDDIVEILGDIYICTEQAERQKEGSFISELKLLTIHGILHLAGYNDGTEEERIIMREKERHYLD